ncbi:hypothetical protein VU11_03120 [Desulfobulbus sp. US2]|uniref:Amino acid transport protein n=1 Tax=Candidatus Electrothrix communis TaxID=1859133 RepID=A0A3S3QKK9_9BACT|nr:hypothetical protein [Desulfobulbus sp. US4]MCW5207652.1 hypothetical protein [Desulfobulbus sp. US2]MCW5210155.1 hypothetical protein [Desulfobulbus sp. N3]MCW5214013.1 hypothetical protein [Desulfobulbus sp. US5]RWX49869.1 hypothetical protein VT98_10023 [Candidatus Electrothrix communis]
MGTPAQLFWGLMFGAIGSGFFIYGKKQNAFVPLGTGLLLCVLPYFITNIYLMLLVGFILMAVPYFFKG